MCRKHVVQKSKAKLPKVNQVVRSDLFMQLLRSMNRTKCTYQLLNNLFDQLAERIVWMLAIQMVYEFGYDFRVCFRFKCMPLRFEIILHIFVVGDDAIMDDNK